MLAPLLLLVVALGIGRCMIGNGFPYLDHWDEPSKVAQVREGWRDYHHPPLMLNIAQLVCGAQVRDLEPQEVAEVGRLMSAIYTGLAIGALCLIALRLAGLLAGGVAAVLLLSDPWLIDHGHYFKEDAILLGGIALALLALTMYLEQPTWRRLAWLTLACGVAAAAKLIGLTVLPLALTAGVLRPPPDTPRMRSLLTVLAGSLTVFALLSLHPALWQDPHAVFDAQRTEWNWLLQGRTPLDSVPHLGFVRLAARSLGLATLVFYPVFVLLCAYRRGPERDRVLPLVVSPLFLVLLLSLQRLVYARYFLPARAVFLTGAAIGVAASLAHLRRTPRAGLRWVLLLACLGLVAHQVHAQVVQGRVLAAGRQHTTRAAMRAWILASLPPGAVVAQDFSVRLRDVPQRVIDTRRLSDLDTVAALLARGATHVVLDAYWYQMHLEVVGDGGPFGKDAAFCRELSKRGAIRLSLPARAPAAMNPALVLLELAAEAE